MPRRNVAVAATVRRDRERPQLVDVTREEATRFAGGGRAIERELVDRHKRIAAPPLPRSSEALAEAVADQERERAQRKRQRDRQARQEYREYLISTGRDPEEFMDEGDDGPSDKARSAPRPTNREALARLQQEADEYDASSGDRFSDRDDEASVPTRRAPGVITDERDLQPLVPARSNSRREAPVFAANQPTVGDVDRLWDWIRADNNTRFIGHKLASSVELHNLMIACAQGEHAANGPVSLVRSLYLQTAPEHPHIGFGILVPVLLPEKVAGLHLYLRADHRGQIAEIAPSLLDVAAKVMPGVRLAVMDANPKWGGFMLSLGFVPHTIFLQEK